PAKKQAWNGAGGTAVFARLLLCFFFFLSAQAETIEEILVVAPPVPSPELPSHREVSARRLREEGINRPVEAVDNLPELQTSASGKTGQTAVFIRGAHSEHTLIWLDDSPLSDPTSPAGGVNLSSLSLSPF